MNILSCLNQGNGILWILVLLLILNQGRSNDGCCDPCGSTDSSWLLWLVIALAFLNQDGSDPCPVCC